jgi:hypothetical protein
MHRPTQHVKPSGQVETQVPFSQRSHVGSQPWHTPFVSVWHFFASHGLHTPSD